MRPPRTGQLRHRLALEAPVRIEAEGGAAAIDWSPVAHVWAAIVPLSGREAVAGDSVRGVVTHELTLRYRAGIQPAMRLVTGSGRVFEIRAVRDPDERRRWLVCDCEEQLP
jgi:SPP1 family predicted phage head-tail adaptor